MDTHHATVAGKEGDGEGELVVLGHVKNSGAAGNSNENAANNQEITLINKFFKEIVGLMGNVDEIHVTGTGQVQEQFIKFLASTPQYKNVKASESTAKKMADEQLLTYISKQLN